MVKKLEELIESDLYRYGYGVSKKTKFLARFFIEGYDYTRLMRRAAYYKKKNSILYYYYRFFLEKKKYKYGFQIPYSLDVGKGLYIGHFGNIVINYKAKLGDNINLSPGVTIGGTNRGKNKGVPIIGNDVWIGTNSVIVGNVKIGDDVLIAPGSFVNFDVPSHSMVMGNPGKIIRKEHATKHYIDNKVK